MTGQAGGVHQTRNKVYTTAKTYCELGALCLGLRVAGGRVPVAAASGGLIRRVHEQRALVPADSQGYYVLSAALCTSFKNKNKVLSTGQAAGHNAKIPL